LLILLTFSENNFPKSENALSLLSKLESKLVCDFNWYYFCANLIKDSKLYNGYKNN